MRITETERDRVRALVLVGHMRDWTTTEYDELRHLVAREYGRPGMADLPPDYLLRTGSYLLHVWDRDRIDELENRLRGSAA